MNFLYTRERNAGGERERSKTTIHEEENHYRKASLIALNEAQPQT